MTTHPIEAKTLLYSSKLPTGTHKDENGTLMSQMHADWRRSFTEKVAEWQGCKGA